MGQAAKVLELPVRTAPPYVRGTDGQARVRGNGRAIAVAKFRELVDKLESGELDGLRAQWLDTHGENFDENGVAVSGFEYVTRTAWTEDGSGTVELKTITIEEV
jgi:hypothetical protein